MLVELSSTFSCKELSTDFTRCLYDSGSFQRMKFIISYSSSFFSSCSLVSKQAASWLRLLVLVMGTSEGIRSWTLALFECVACCLTQLRKSFIEHSSGLNHLLSTSQFLTNGTLLSRVFSWSILSNSLMISLVVTFFSCLICSMNSF